MSTWKSSDDAIFIFKIYGYKMPYFITAYTEKIRYSAKYYDIERDFGSMPPICISFQSSSDSIFPWLIEQLNSISATLILRWLFTRSYHIESQSDRKIFYPNINIADTSTPRKSIFHKEKGLYFWAFPIIQQDKTIFCLTVPLQNALFRYSLNDHSICLFIHITIDTKICHLFRVEIHLIVFFNI